MHSDDQNVHANVKFVFSSCQYWSPIHVYCQQFEINNTAICTTLCARHPNWHVHVFDWWDWLIDSQGHTCTGTIHCSQKVTKPLCILMIAQIWYVVLDKVCKNLKDHLMWNILTPHLIRLTRKCRRSDYCYANGPKIKIAVGPNDMPLSLQRMDIIQAVCNFFYLGIFAFITIVTDCVYIFRSIWSNEVSKCSDLNGL